MRKKQREPTPTMAIDAIDKLLGAAIWPDIEELPTGSNKKAKKLLATWAVGSIAVERIRKFIKTKK